jgi:hypothetical protein
MSASDEPRLLHHKDCATRGFGACDCHPITNHGGPDSAEPTLAMRALGEIRRRVTEENAPVVAAVLAEVARQDAGGTAPVEETPWHRAIRNAALAIREAMRLKGGRR